MSVPQDHISNVLDADARLKDVTPIIESLYIDENLPAPVVTILLDKFFQFKISEGNLRKRFVKKTRSTAGVKKRMRTKDPRARSEEALQHVTRPNNFIRHWPLLQSQPRLHRYELQDRVVYCVKKFLDSMFVQGSCKTWRTTPTGFICPDGTELSPDKWQAAEAHCDSISTMLRCNQTKAAQKILTLLKDDLVHAFQQMDPLFLCQIWKLALVLHGFDRRAPRLQAVSSVLGGMRLSAQTRHGRESPLAAILGCVLDVQEADFRTTMQIGFRETLKNLDQKVTQENMVVLKLWSTYAQYYCKPYVKPIKRKPYVKPIKRKPLLSSPAPPPKSSIKAARHHASVSDPHKRLREHIRGDIMLLKFNQVWQQCYNPEKLPLRLWRQSRVCLRVSHHYAYAAFWVCGEADLAENMARNIIEDTQPDLTRHPVWNSNTMAFTVARKIIATIQQQKAELSACERTMMETISLLREGDSNCRIRAVGLCLTLSSWERKWGDRESSSDTDALLCQIQGEIEGLVMCRNCEPSLKFKDCSRNRSNCPGCQSTTRKACRTCKNAGQRRRNTIKARQELADFAAVSTSATI